MTSVESSALNTAMSIQSDEAMPADRGAGFLALHSGPGFVIPNAWDAGSARILEGVGFPAIATTSAGRARARER